MRRAFLDANVLFSAAYREGAGLLALWRLPETSLLTSAYAIEVARRNLDSPEARERLEKLLRALEIVAEDPNARLPRSLRLAGKDRPILQAAIAAGAMHLVTGDVTDFGSLLGRQIMGVLVLTPAGFLREKPGA